MRLYTLAINERTNYVNEHEIIMKIKLQRFLAKALILLGQSLIAFSIGSIIVIFTIVLITGSWPEFFEPIRKRLEIGYNIFGNFWSLILLMLLIGPGSLLISYGEKLRDNH